MRPRLLALLALLMLALVGAGCGDDSSSSDTGGASSDPQSASEQPAQETETAPEVDPKDTSVKPVIDKPTGSPPKRLVKEDIVKGKGAPAKPGDTVTVQYVGVNFSNGEQFDASWDRGQPFTFQIGGNVIPGWNKGIVGMKPGGRRKLTIPPELGYGPSGTPDGAIPPNETLVFVVDLQSIDS